MTVWYEMLAFDILGEMAFGESFHCIEDGRPHYWQQMIAKHLYFITVVDNLCRYPLMRWLGGKLLPWLTIEIQNKHSGFSRAKISRFVGSSYCIMHYERKSPFLLKRDSRLASRAPRKVFSQT